MNHRTTALCKEKLATVERLMRCRLARMPVQYIIGEWDFYNITLKMRPPVFIPRPETEQLVDMAVQRLRDIKTPRVLELCCGSGAISLALLSCLKDLECVAVDQSKHAMQLCSENAKNLGLLDRLYLVEEKVKGNELSRLPYKTYDMIVSNPPYVLRKDLMDVEPEVKLYEDMRALDGGKNGMDVIISILKLSEYLLSCNSPLLMEVDPCHRYLVPAWLNQEPQMQIIMTEVFQDFNGKDRFLEFRNVGILLMDNPIQRPVPASHQMITEGINAESTTDHNGDGNVVRGFLDGLCP